MPQMFDWIFFAIVLPLPAYLLWDWYQHRSDPSAGRQAGPR
ncbi:MULTISPECIES: hypothetical protein [Methylobacterium]|nr:MULTISPECIES: hypothetical protein [Methylobacterium]